MSAIQQQPMGGMQQQQQPQQMNGAGMPGQTNGAGMPQQQQRPGAGFQQAPKTAYAKKVKNGERPVTRPIAGVQSGNAPVEAAGDYEQVNQGLLGDAPRMASFYRDTSTAIADLDRSSFADGALPRGRGGNSKWANFARGRGRGGPMMSGMGSMMGGMGGSMYGGNPMMSGMGGSMYGGNPMTGGMGSMYGNPMMGSMYGNPMMMGGMGGPGSMYAPGSMYGASYASRPASMFGSMNGSMYGDQQPGSMMGGGPGGNSAYGGGYGSMYGAPDPQQQQQPGQSMPGSMYGMAPAQSAYGQPGSMYGTGPSGLDAAGDGSAPAPAALTRTLSAGPGGDKPGGAQIPAHVLLIEAAPAPGAAPCVRADPANPTKCLLLGAESRPVLVDQVCAGANAPQIITNWKQGAHFRTLIDHVAAGHSVAVMASSDDAPASMASSMQVAEAVLLEAIARVDTAVKADAPLGYADAQLFCYSFRSADQAKDVLAGPAAPYGPVQPGSNPLFGPGFMQAHSKIVSVGNDGAKAVMEALQAITPQMRADDPVQFVQLVVKQVRNNAKTNSPDILISSVLVIIGNAQVGGRVQSTYFDAMRDESIILQALVRAAIGGSCSALSVLSLSTATPDPAKAVASLSSLLDLHSVANGAPRSGSLTRFLAFAKTESDKLSQRADPNPVVVEKVTAMLNDGEAIMQNPRANHPKAFPITTAPSKNTAATPSSAPTQGMRAAPGGAVTPSSGSGVAQRSLAPAATPGSVSSSAPNAANPIRCTIIVGTLPTSAQTIAIAPDGQSIMDLTTGATATVNEVVSRAADDWRTTESDQARQVQDMFQNGYNTAIFGTVSPTEVNTLDKQPLWLSYKRMVSSMLSVASKNYTFAEVSISMSLIDGKDVATDLFANLETAGAPATAPAPGKLILAVSPLFGPTVYKAAVIKPPTPLQLESTINSALYQVPTLMEQAKNGYHIIYASAVLKAVTKDGDVLTCSFVGASTTDPRIFIDIIRREPTAPYELLDYAFGGPCATLFLADVNQGDNNVGAVLELIAELAKKTNRPVQPCSVRRFVAYTGANLPKFDARIAAATSEKEKATLEKGKKSMEAFYTDYKALLENPQSKDPKSYRNRSSRSSDGVSTGSRSSSRRSADGASRGSRSRTSSKDHARRTPSSSAADPDKRTPGSSSKDPKRSSSRDKDAKSSSSSKKRSSSSSSKK